MTREDAVGVTLAAERKLRGRSRVRTALEQRWITQFVQLAAGGDSTQHFANRSLNLFVERDRRDNPFDPVRGSLGTLLGQVTGGALGGTSSFLKMSRSGSWYRPLAGVVVAARLRGGWIHPFGTRPAGKRAVDLVPREERFRAGGATTVRGYPEDSLGPQVVAAGQREPATQRGLVTVVTNLELRFPIVWRFSGALFLDGGNVWEEARDVSLRNFVPDREDAAIEDMRYATGGGLRLGTPVGPLRLDYGYSLTRGLPEREVEALRGGEWHLSLGQAF